MKLRDSTNLGPFGGEMFLVTACNLVISTSRSQVVASREGFISFMACGTQTQRDGYTMVPGWRSSLAVNVSERQLTPGLGTVQGDDEHCRRVCSLVGGCNLIARVGRMCLLDTACPSVPRDIDCHAGALTMVASRCRSPAKWHMLTYMIPNEGAHISVMFAPNPMECQRVCTLTASCNSFRFRVRNYIRRAPEVECHLKTRCVDPQHRDVLHDHNAIRALIEERRLSPLWATHFKTQCTGERFFFPTPGVRRSPLPPTGLLSIDCRDRNLAHRLNVSDPKHAQALTFSCGVPIGSPRPSPASVTVTALRWPPYYTPAREPVLRQPLRWQREQREWQGADVNVDCTRPDFVLMGCGPHKAAAGRRLQDAPRQRGRKRSKPPKRATGASSQKRQGFVRAQQSRARVQFKRASQSSALHETFPVEKTLFARVAQQVAARAFNGKEVILTVSDGGGLPLAVNLAASLAKVKLYHYLILAADESVCPLLTTVDAPACVWSSLLRQYRARLNAYRIRAFQLMWLQRWYYVRRLLQLGINCMLLDTDVVLYRDPYTYFKGVFANHSLFGLMDSSVTFAKTNGGTWYFQPKSLRGPVMHLIDEFERRTFQLIGNRSVPPIRYARNHVGLPAGEVADRMTDDQFVISNWVLFSAHIGRDVAYRSYTEKDMPETAWRGLPVGRSFWDPVGQAFIVPPEIGAYGELRLGGAYLRRYSLRERELQHNGIKEHLMLAPSWLFSGESDSGASTKGWPARTLATYWGHDPPPMVLAHFVCTAWPGSGGRVTAMELWGKWFAADIAYQLQRKSDYTEDRTGTAAAGEDAPAAGKVVGKAAGKLLDSAVGGVVRPFGFDAHAWVRACGLACGLDSDGCTTVVPGYVRPSRSLQLCSIWLHGTSWMHSPRKLWGIEGSDLPPGTKHPPAVTALHARMRRAGSSADFEVELMKSALEDPQLASASSIAEAALLAVTTHPRALIALRRPIEAADRREYQLFVRLLFTAAMLTGRRPVLPLSHCTEGEGEWSMNSRCVYVLQAVKPIPATYCVIRPPTKCHDRIALPTVLTGVADADQSVVRLEPLALRNASVDVVGFARKLGEHPEWRQQQLLLLDTDDLTTAEDLANLLYSPKGWLCPLEHKICQFTCT